MNPLWLMFALVFLTLSGLKVHISRNLYVVIYCCRSKLATAKNFNKIGGEQPLQAFKLLPMLSEETLTLRAK